MQIEKDNDFDGAVLNCAVRYALGRMSYMPGLVIDQITPVLSSCSDKTLWCFERDISNWLENSARGDIDSKGKWTAFLCDVRKEQEKRKNNH